MDIYQINDVLIPPGNVSQAVQAVGDYPLLTFGNQVQVPGPSGSNITIVQALENTHGLTLFAPVSSAFTSQANQTLQSLQQNSPQQFLNGVHNHYINGSTVYSPTLREVAASGNGGAPYTSAGGQYFSFTTNNTGLYVSVGNDTNARVVIPDVLVENGVIHFIDTVLFQTNGNDEVASSAFASASAAATESSTDTQAIIFPEPTG
ncbi:fasciclin domain-containing protein, partial [Pectobacterium atrosepticum]|nr:fasciclin domain-containing protein [Pectobacterium atrosepticum]